MSSLILLNYSHSSEELSIKKLVHVKMLIGLSLALISNICLNFQPKKSDTGLFSLSLGVSSIEFRRLY